MFNEDFCTATSLRPQSSKLIHAPTIAVRNSTNTVRSPPSLAVKPLENVRSVSTMPTCLAEQDRVVDRICTEYAHILSQNMSSGRVHAPRKSALWCESWAFRTESGTIVRCMRQIEQRGRARLHEGHTVDYNGSEQGQQRDIYKGKDSPTHSAYACRFLWCADHLATVITTD